MLWWGLVIGAVLLIAGAGFLVDVLWLGLLIGLALIVADWVAGSARRRR